MNKASSILMLGTLALTPVAAHSQVQPSSEIRTADGRLAQPQSRLVGEFSAFAGSDDNARSLVTGLRQGREITLSGERPADTATFTPATRPMGYGNVRIALALAREQLAQNGISQPTPDQLRAALAGGVVVGGSSSPGSTVRLPGVLQMRADGMGWGRIAQSMGVKLGPVLTGRTSLQGATTTSTASTSTAAAKSSITTAAGSKGISPASGTGSSSALSHAHSRVDTGIVTAAGTPTAAFGAGMRGGGNPGLSTAAGAERGNAAGLGLAKGHAGR